MWHLLDNPKRAQQDHSAECVMAVTMKKSSFWVMLLLDAYALVCMAALLLLFAEVRMPAFSLTHN
ncbi:hypothetical protein D3870_08570 [Noviherbaspirillum cavernae]|uniref:Uncharacterized protein n=1 Tax=Noviherbaspirillum cavernae TaxID=2320862 RepID=A0A418X0P5_9BURK|nr:hypothetical protein [Noviherbaspirillum cavernae]RJG06056.1 hypothetical protein D3870_08570 [Noviherbaspirillum cavernae]